MTAGIFTTICANFLFPLHEFIKGHRTVRVRRFLEKSQWWTRDALQSYQTQRLREFLIRINQRVPYYREQFRGAQFDPSTIRDVTDLQKLPLLGKAEIRKAGNQMKALGAARLNRYNTGGSTGEPLVFYTTIDRRSHDVAAKWRATRWWGVDIGDPEIVVWGSPIELGAQDLLRNCRDRIMRSTLLPAFDMSDASLDGHLAVIRDRRPVMLFGYPSSLSLIAKHARRSGARMDDLGIKVAFVTSERLYDDQREQISSVFGCPVANGYGGRDAGFIAHECPSGGMHISAEDIIVETVAADGRLTKQGEPGEIVVTHMATGDFPFVRYRTGDVGILDDSVCECGRSLPVLREIQGRTTDFIIASDGRRMHGLALIYSLRQCPGIDRFKVVQNSRTNIEVFIVPGPGFTGTEQDFIRSDFKRRLGECVEVSIAVLDTIPTEPNGKYRYVISHAV